MVKKGDTLIEVTLAVGIFSMVAIAVVGVMTSGTSNAQNALETTLAREEIDTQAEALRFIHSAYLADDETGDDKDPYSDLWQKITDPSHIYTPGTNTVQNQAIQQFKPTNCDQIYGDEGSLKENLSQYAFIINPRLLGSDPEKAYIRYADSSNTFKAAATSPRLIFTDKQATNTDSLIENSATNSLQKAEGIYVIGVADPNSTFIVDPAKNTPAYYDFYIRTCWYGTGSEAPSTISTVIRLYNPAGIATGVENADSNISGTRTVTVKFVAMNGTGSMESITLYPGYSLDLNTLSPTFTPLAGYNFIGYLDASQNKITEITIPADLRTSETKVVYVHYGRYSVSYNANGGSYAPATTYCDNPSHCVLSSQEPSRSGYKFKGWASNASATTPEYQPGQILSLSQLETNLYAVWETKNETITIKLTFSSGDCDSHVQGQKSDGSKFHAYYSQKIGSDLSGLTIAQLDHDYTSGGTETFVVNTLGGKNYYYYVHDYNGCQLSSTRTYVTVSGPSFAPITYYSNQASGSGSYWNVFAYKDGRIVTGQTRSNSPNISY